MRALTAIAATALSASALAAELSPWAQDAVARRVESTMNVAMRAETDPVEKANFADTIRIFTACNEFYPYARHLSASEGGSPEKLLENYLLACVMITIAPGTFDKCVGSQCDALRRIKAAADRIDRRNMARRNR